MTAATGGTYSLANKSVTGTFDLTAGSNDGTTLIGNANTPQILTASLAGNDTLIGGTGGDNFYAGTGIDTITGHGIGNTLYASGDLTHDVITGIQIMIRDRM
jgi:Ca2+-binding RTX toxin-like protein